MDEDDPVAAAAAAGQGSGKVGDRHPDRDENGERTLCASATVETQRPPPNHLTDMRTLPRPPSVSEPFRFRTLRRPTTVPFPDSSPPPTRYPDPSPARTLPFSFKCRSLGCQCGL